VSVKTKIVAFCCNWCAYAGADLAGLNRMQYPPDVRIIRVPCSGRINPSLFSRHSKREQMGYWWPGDTPATATMLVAIILQEGVFL